MNAFEGELQSLPLERVLQAIAAAGGSGILTVQGEDDIVAVSFQNGGIVAADALNQTAEEGLGEALQSLRLISAEDLTAAARDHAGGSSGSLGELLVERNLVSRSDLLQGLRTQTLRLMLQILTWRQGEFKFYGGDEVSYEEGFKPIPVAELLVRAIDELGGRAGLPGPVPRLDAVYRSRPPAGKVRILGSDGDGSGTGTWIGPGQAELLAALDGQRTAAAIARELGLDDHHARFALYVLGRHELIAHVGEAAPTPARRPAGPRTEDREAPDVGTPDRGAPDRGAPARRPAARRPQPAEPAASLRAEIFTPPEPGLAGVPGLEPPLVAAAAGPAEEAEPAPPIALEQWVIPALALGLVAAMVLALLARPGASLLPFPWQENQRTALERQLRQSLFLKIDRAAKVYFLVMAHYPDSLDDLVDLGLLSQADLEDPAGYRLSYSTDEVGYRIDVLDPRVAGGTDRGPGDRQSAEGLSTTESITGDFLLDPQWLRVGSTEEAPLVLLD